MTAWSPRAALLCTLAALAGCVGFAGSDWALQDELCNGLDDDGDGFVDAEPSGAPLRLDCSNACGAGTLECVGGEWQACSAPQPSEEVCNGIDDDCDGEVDEDCDCVHGETRVCRTGAAGECGRGLERCEGGEWSECDQFYFPGDFAEVCDGRDNDCDGVVDEGADCPCEMVHRSGRTYLFCAEGERWEAARDFCSAWGYDLATIETSTENRFIADAAIERVPRHAWWIGLSDAEEEGLFRWVSTGRSPTYTSWYGNEPNDGRGNEDCAAINFGSVGGWNDLPCWEVRSFVCESPR